MKINSILCFKCFCEKEISPIGKDYFMFAIDKPYINLFFHKDCYRSIKDDMQVYLTQNEHLFYNYREKF